MKHLLFAMAVAAIISCNNNENKTPATNTADTIVTNTNNTNTAPSQEKVLENELKNFITVLTSKDKDKTKQLFNFPVADSTLSVYLDGTGNQLGYNNKGLITEEVFLKNFDKIYKFWMLDNTDEFNDFLKNIKPDSLSTKKEIYSEEPSEKTKPCYKRYNLRIDKDIISLSYGYNSNPKYNKRNNSYISEEEMCEAAIIWEFKFDGKKLIFIRQVAAG